MHCLNRQLYYNNTTTKTTITPPPPPPPKKNQQQQKLTTKPPPPPKIEKLYSIIRIKPKLQIVHLFFFTSCIPLRLSLLTIRKDSMTFQVLTCGKNGKQEIIHLQIKNVCEVCRKQSGSSGCGCQGLFPNPADPKPDLPVSSRHALMYRGYTLSRLPV